MRKSTILKSLLLLCAFVAGSSSVWAKQYKKVTSASELVNGAKYLIVSAEASSKFYTIGTVNSNNRTAVEVSVSDNIATATVATASGSSNAHEVMLIASSTNWNLYDVANALYLNGGCQKSSGNGNNNNLKTQSSVETTAGKGKYNGVWSITIANNTNVATIKNQNNFSIKYNPNNGSPLIASYSSGQTDVYLYKEIAEPAAPITSCTWDFSSTVTQTAALNGAEFTASAENTLYDTNLFSTIIYSAGSGDEMNANGYLKSNGTSGPSAKRYFILEIANSGSLEIFSRSTFGTYSIKKAATASTSWSDATDIATITTTTEGTGVSADITYDADKPFLFIGLTVKAYTQKINWTPTTDNITLTTTDNMDGWRSFYDATQDYEVDAKTKIYVAAKSSEENSVTLTPLDATKIPHGVAVILKTSAADHKMTLTKTTGATSLGDNVLSVTDGTSNADGYRLGYKADPGVAFFKYTTTTAPAAGIVYIDKANVNTGATAPEFLTIGGETTGINAVNGSEFMVNGSDIYNLNGQRVAQPTKGLYIVNGRKVIIK